MMDDVLERADRRPAVHGCATPGVGPCADCELIAALAAEVRELLDRVENFKSLARLVVDGQLRETEQERGIYRRGFRALLEACDGGRDDG